MTPTIGRIVQYRLSAEDAVQIMRRRTTGQSIAERMRRIDSEHISRPAAWPQGAQAHIGTDVSEGDVFPMLIVRVSAPQVNGQVFLDGTDVLWVTSVVEGDGPQMWSWPPRV